MKKLKCQTCLVQATCTKLCTDFAAQVMQIDHEIKANKERIFSRNRIHRKRLKDQTIFHYNALIKKWNKAIKIRDDIWERQFNRIGLLSSNSNSSLMKDILRSYPIIDYVEDFYRKFNNETAVKLKADHTMLFKGRLKCYKTRRSP